MSRFSLFRSRQTSQNTDLPGARGSDFAQAGSGRGKHGGTADADDPILPEKKRARRRLVGAVTMILTAFIVLPMIFDSEPPAVSHNLLIDIPSRDRPARIAADEDAGKKEQKATAPEPEVSTASSEVAPVDKKGTEKGTEKSTEKAAEKSIEKTAETAPPKVPADKAQDDLIGQVIARAQSASAKEIVIQVAAVSSADKAKVLQDKLKTAGLNSYTQKVSLDDGSERIRIRIGPLSDKKEVDNTCAKLIQLDLPCKLVN